MDRKKVLNEVIRIYRNILDDRYQYDSLLAEFELPKTITEKQINELRTYFLTYVYPDNSKREVLNEAFESLDSYIKNPNKLLQILLNSVAIFFKHGRHLPKIFNSGISALRSYRAANDFEKKIVDQALNNNLHPPYSNDQIFRFISLIPRKEIDQFIDSTRALFGILHDDEQVQKIIEIMHFLIDKMKAKPTLYTQKEIDGLSIGKELIEKGYALFENLGAQNQELLIDFIVDVETKHLNTIFSSNS